MNAISTKEYTVEWSEPSTERDDRAVPDSYSKSFSDKKAANDFLEHLRKTNDLLLTLTFTTTTKKTITIIDR